MNTSIKKPTIIVTVLLTLANIAETTTAETVNTTKMSTSIATSSMGTYTGGFHS